MKNVKWPTLVGVIQDVGKSQGYEPCSVRYNPVIQANTKTGQNEQIGYIAEVLYAPTVEERQTLLQGGKVKVSFELPNGTLLQPHRLEVVG